MCGPHHCLGRGASAPNTEIVRALLQRHQNASIIGQRCAGHSPNSANRKHQITRHPRRTSPPLRPSLSFRYTQSAALSKLTLNPPKFLDLKIPLPATLEEQRQIAAWIETVAGKVGDAQLLRDQARE